MEIQQIDILLRLLIAHLLADFIFQTDRIAEGKKNGIWSKHFYLHVLVVGLVTYLLLGMWTNWKIPLLVMVLHAAIDFGKSLIKKDNVYVFLLDQSLHVLTIIGVWLLITNNSISQFLLNAYGFVFLPQVLMVVMAYLIVTIPIAILIGYMIESWQNEIGIYDKDSLKNAGRWIGIIERVLILTFILLHQWAPIGFLLAAKSVFRFGDLREGKDRKRTEYILIGTLLSFTFAILVGLGVIIMHEIV